MNRKTEGKVARTSGMHWGPEDGDCNFRRIIDSKHVSLR